MDRRIIGVLAVAIAVVAIWGVATAEGSSLDRAIALVKRGSTEEYLVRHSLFMSIEGNHDAQHWLGFFFSGMSTSTWTYDNDEYVEYHGVTSRDGMPVCPSNVVFLPCLDSDTPQSLLETNMKAQWNREVEYQVLVSVSGNRIRARGYEGFGAEPVVTEEWSYPSGLAGK